MRAPLASLRVTPVALLCDGSCGLTQSSAERAERSTSAATYGRAIYGRSHRATSPWTVIAGTK
ncbi:MAG TPA: hypothetical protein VK542_01695, partial [Gemmatimonadaceae bacterium]|nr:hypothetical protein [Gemmatimonadaceae bacterium]